MLSAGKDKVYRSPLVFPLPEDLFAALRVRFANIEDPGKRDAGAYDRCTEVAGTDVNGTSVEQQLLQVQCTQRYIPDIDTTQIPDMNDSSKADPKRKDSLTKGQENRKDYPTLYRMLLSMEGRTSSPYQSFAPTVFREKELALFPPNLQGRVKDCVSIGLIAEDQKIRVYCDGEVSAKIAYNFSDLAEIKDQPHFSAAFQGKKLGESSLFRREDLTVAEKNHWLNNQGGDYGLCSIDQCEQFSFTPEKEKEKFTLTCIPPANTQLKCETKLTGEKLGGTNNGAHSKSLQGYQAIAKASKDFDSYASWPIEAIRHGEPYQYAFQNLIKYLELDYTDEKRSKLPIRNNVALLVGSPMFAAHRDLGFEQPLSASSVKLRGGLEALKQLYFAMLHQAADLKRLSDRAADDFENGEYVRSNLALTKDASAVDYPNAFGEKDAAAHPKLLEMQRERQRVMFATYKLASLVKQINQEDMSAILAAMTAWKKAPSLDAAAAREAVLLEVLDRALQHIEEKDGYPQFPLRIGAVPVRQRMLSLLRDVYSFKHDEAEVEKIAAPIASGNRQTPTGVDDKLYQTLLRASDDVWGIFERVPQVTVAGEAGTDESGGLEKKIAALVAGDGLSGDYQKRKVWPLKFDYTSLIQNWLQLENNFSDDPSMVSADVAAYVEVAMASLSAGEVKADDLRRIAVIASVGAKRLKSGSADYLNKAREQWDKKLWEKFIGAASQGDTSKDFVKFIGDYNDPQSGTLMRELKSKGLGNKRNPTAYEALWFSLKFIERARTVGAMGKETLRGFAALNATHMQVNKADETLDPKVLDETLAAFKAADIKDGIGAIQALPFSGMAQLTTQGKVSKPEDFAQSSIEGMLLKDLPAPVIEALKQKAALQLVGKGHYALVLSKEKHAEFSKVLDDYPKHTAVERLKRALELGPIDGWPSERGVSTDIWSSFVMTEDADVARPAGDELDEVSPELRLDQRIYNETLTGVGGFGLACALLKPIVNMRDKDWEIRQFGFGEGPTEDVEYVDLAGIALNGVALGFGLLNDNGFESEAGNWIMMGVATVVAEETCRNNLNPDNWHKLKSAPPAVEPGKPADSDSDGDGVEDKNDNCPNVKNADQKNSDGDAQGDACDVTEPPAPDADGDGVPDANDICPLGADGVDADGNGVPDACDRNTDPNPTDDGSFED